MQVIYRNVCNCVLKAFVSLVLCKCFSQCLVIDVDNSGRYREPLQRSAVFIDTQGQIAHARSVPVTDPRGTETRETPITELHQSTTCTKHLQVLHLLFPSCTDKIRQKKNLNTNWNLYLYFKGLRFSLRLFAVFFTLMIPFRPDIKLYIV